MKKKLFGIIFLVALIMMSLTSNAFAETIEDVLNTVKGGFPLRGTSIPEHAWLNENGAKLYLYEPKIAFDGSSISSGGFMILTNVTLNRSEGNYTYTKTNPNGYTITFNMDENNRLISVNCSDYFIEDKPNSSNINGTYVPQTHNFTYEAENNIITATCSKTGCPLTDNKLSLTLTAPESLAYTGSPIEIGFGSGEADAWTGASLELPTIMYTANDGSQLTDEKAVNTGSYTATIKVDTDKTATLDFEIVKATPYIKTAPAPNAIDYGEKLSDSTLFGGCVQVSETNTTEIGGLFEWTNGDIIPNVSDSETTLYSVTFTPFDEKNYNTVSCEVTITINSLEPLKGELEIIAEADNFIYGDTAKLGYKNLSIEGHNDLISSLEVIYYKEDGITKTNISDGASEEGAMPSNVGTYTAVISIPESNEDYFGNQSVTFTIAQKEITIKANDKTVYVGSEVPQLNESDYIVTGLVGSDTLITKPTLSYESTPDMSAVGTIAIKASDAEASLNYTIKYEDGILTIKKKSSSIGGGSSNKVTIKFDTNGGNDVKNISVKKGQKIGTIENPQKEGFVFDCWYKDKECTKTYDINEQVTSSTTLYAGWKVDPARQITLKIGQKEAMVLGKQKTNDVAPIIKNERTMLPARFVAEALGAKVEWDGEERKVLITKDNVEIVIYIDSEVAYVNGEKVILDSPAFIENDRTYTPIRFISERLNAEVEWIEETKEVVITKNI